MTGKVYNFSIDADEEVNMKISMRKITAWSLIAMLVAISAAAIADPFLGSKKDPHATLYLNVDQRAKQIYPVKMWMVDGKQSNREDQGVLWVTPGDYTFTFKMGVMDPSIAQGLERDSGSKRDQPHDLKVTIEAGKAYYIGGKVGSQGTWEPVVWKTEDQSN